jgi:hypothetical protein
LPSSFNRTHFELHFFSFGVLFPCSFHLLFLIIFERITFYLKENHQAFFLNVLLSLGSGAVRGSYRSSVDGDGGEMMNGGPQPLHRAALYIFVDKAQMKGIKVDSHPKADYIPVDYPEPRRIKAAFKKLMRACHPSSVPQVP